jgi:hypothetical protein
MALDADAILWFVLHQTRRLCRNYLANGQKEIEMGLREQAESRGNADGAFERAIASGRLSTRIGAKNYAGDYMFMGSDKGRDFFKHVETRKYLPLDYDIPDHQVW